MGEGQYGAPSQPADSLDYIAQLDRFDELHGDRQFRDDPAIVGGFALLHGRAVMAIGQQRGRDTKENLRRNFGMVTPEGYRKVQRLAHMASRLGLPIVTFIDTKGADPGISSEEHAQSEAIAMCLQEFTEARVPIVATIIGEGGSGGALALGIADHVIMLETCGVLGCIARRLCRDPLGRCEQGGGSRGAVEADLGRFAAVWYHR